ncbi:MAG: hypothetical protein ACRDJU_14780 [Actinomycetota bacterium]
MWFSLAFVAAVGLVLTWRVRQIWSVYRAMRLWKLDRRLRGRPR